MIERRLIVLKTKKSLMIIAVLSLVLVIGLTEASFAGTVKARTSGHMVGTNGKIAYYAIGIDGGGPLYKYNSSTKKKKKIASGKWEWLNLKGKYLYLCKNDFGGSEGRCTYVYRMKTNGKGKKKLASGSHPIVKGKYIYYLGIKKKKNYDGVTVDDRVTGIYRMKLNGKGKKKLVSFSDYYYTLELAMSGNKVLYLLEDGWYKYDPKTKKQSYLDKDVVRNIESVDDYSGAIEYCRSGKLVCYTDENRVYIEKGDWGKKVTLSGDPQKIIISGKHIMVVTHELASYYVYMMKSNGTKLKKVEKGEEVSGGWDY